MKSILAFVTLVGIGACAGFQIAQAGNLSGSEFGLSVDSIRMHSICLVFSMEF
jgi:hypothetical protein